MAQVTLGVGQQDTMLKLLSLKAWMKSRNLKKSDKVKILAAFNQINEGAPFDEKQVQYRTVQTDADFKTLFHGLHADRRVWLDRSCRSCHRRWPPTSPSSCTASCSTNCPSFVDLARR